MNLYKTFYKWRNLELFYSPPGFETSTSAAAEIHKKDPRTK